MAKETAKPKKDKASKTDLPCLFIVESPTKIKTLQKILDKTKYSPAASVGHCFRLPKKDFVDTKDGFKLKYEVDPAKKDVVKKLTDLAEGLGDTIYFATDADTEGAVIARHLHDHFYKKFKKTKNYVRVNLKEITKTGVANALAAAYPMSDPKEDGIVQAGLLRRIEDRFTGFKISPLAFIYVQEGTSAGRVQSPALRILVEREKEIAAFVPEVYYEIFADLFPTGKTDVFKAKYTKAIKDEKTAKTIVASSKGKPIVINDIAKKQINSKPPAPFITKTLLASASTILNWKAAKTTSVAQTLFQSGHITYIRCDNTVISEDGQKMLLKHVNTTFPKEYHSKGIPSYNDPKAKLEHECIRPTQLDTIPMFANADEKKLYEMIRKRFVASALPPAVYDSVSVDISIGAHPFKATGSTLTFEGYLKEWDYSTKSDTTLPPLTTATSLSLRDIYDERKETKPPSRYKDASLIDALEKKGIGKPSTFKSILDILDSRGYIKYDKQSLVPTELGMRLHEFLDKYFLKIIDFDFTARIESEQEEVEAGKLTYVDAVTAFYKHLNEEIKVAQGKIASDRDVDEKTTHICPTCKEQVLLRKINRKEGKHFYSCAGYLDKSCTATFTIAEDGSPVKAEATLEVLKDCPGEKCDGKLVKRVNKKTKQVFYACTAWASGCKVTADEHGTVRVPVAVKKLGKKCSKCGKGDMVERTSKSGDKFAACNKFPKCKNTESIDESK